jgi:hypothetical protein
MLTMFRDDPDRKPFERYSGPPMTLGNMRHNGVRSLMVSCPACHRETVLDVEANPDDVPLPAFGPHMVCTKCGMIGAAARPNWNDRRRRTGVIE